MNEMNRLKLLKEGPHAWPFAFHAAWSAARRGGAVRRFEAAHLQFSSTLAAQLSGLSGRAFEEAKHLLHEEESRLRARYRNRLYFGVDRGRLWHLPPIVSGS